MLLVSVIVPAYNAAAYLAETLESVRQQTYRHWELIIVDDGSTDSTATIANHFASLDPRIRTISRENGRLAKARNTGMASASGDLIAFLDADDIWHPRKLEKQIEAQAQSKAGLVFTKAALFSRGLDSPEGPTFSTQTGRLTGQAMFEILYEGNIIPVSSVLVTRSELSHCRFDESPDIYGLEDYDLWLCLSSRGTVFYGIPEELLLYRCHSAQMSNDAIRMAWNTISVRRKYDDVARQLKINVESRNREALRQLAFLAANVGDQRAAWTAIKRLLSPKMCGVAGFAVMVGPALHALFHALTTSHSR